MEQSFVSYLKDLESIDEDLHTAITQGQEPLDMKIENMEDETLGFIVEYQIKDK